jgi:hypothetical protein
MFTDADASTSTGQFVIQLDHDAYLCLHCCKPYSNATELDKHYEEYHYCKLCQIKFTDAQYYYTHLLEKHVDMSSMPVKCEICNDNNISDILKHIKSHAYGKSYEHTLAYKDKIECEKKNSFFCKKCALVINGNEQHHICEYLNCFQCDAKYKERSDLVEHIQTSHFKDNKCVVCNRNSKNMPDVIEHLNTCGVKWTFRTLLKNPVKVNLTTCNECHISYRNIEEHRNSHHYCSHCKQSFSNINEVVFHLLDSNVKRKKFKYCCYICLLKFPNLVKLNRHVRSHLYNYKNTIFKTFCGICKKQHLNVHAYLRHVYRSHLTYYVCNLCNIEEENISNIEVHMIEHEKMEMMKCKSCEIGFSSMEEFIAHKKIDHTCNICSIRLKFRDGLIRHLYSSHDENRECKFCYRIFESKIELNNHLEIHSESYDKFRACKYCNQQFSLLFVLPHELECGKKAKEIVIMNNMFCKEAFLDEASN